MIMMAVIVGTALQLGEDGIGSPSAIFLISLSSSFFIAACLHPQEFWCIVPGIIYLLSIPSMYLLLILYSIINLNVVSWGTREVQVKKTKKVRSFVLALPDSFSFLFSPCSTNWTVFGWIMFVNFEGLYIYHYSVKPSQETYGGGKSRWQVLLDNFTRAASFFCLHMYVLTCL